jgi:aminomethyltransferase
MTDKTILNATHRALGARMVDFGGWDMPVEYSGLVAEHKAVRERVGLFDVSHMGEIEVSGPEALRLVQTVTTNDASKLKDGQAQYSGLLYEHGGFVDDIIVHRVDHHNFFICVNASNQDKDFDHILKYAMANKIDAYIEDQGPLYAQLALQGPLATDVLRALTPTDLGAIKRYHFADGLVCGEKARIAHTGYTGEDGWEIYVAPQHAEKLWVKMLREGMQFQILPCGLGARNTLRMEAAMPLYGHEITASTTPYEAGLDWIVKLEKGDFVGRDALVKQQEAGITRKLIGFEMLGRGIARDGYEIFTPATGEPGSALVGIGWVTSGGPSPTLNKNIGMGYVPVAMAEPGRRIDIMVRGRAVEAVTVALPFYKRAK